MPLKKIRLEIITPERVVYDKEVEFIEATAIDGEIGILPGHAPLVTGLKTGLLRVNKNGDVLKISISEGFMEVQPARITILIRTAELPHEIDIERARKAMGRAEERLSSNDDKINYTRAEAALERAIARLKAAGEK